MKQHYCGHCSDYTLEECNSAIMAISPSVYGEEDAYDEE